MDQSATNSKIASNVKELNYVCPLQHKLSVSDWQVLGSKLSAKSSYWKHVGPSYDASSWH